MYNFRTQNLFPLPIVTSNIGRPFTDAELACVQEHKSRTYTNAGNTTSLNSYILESEFPDVKEYILEAIKHYGDTVLSIPDNNELYITQSWLNFTEPGQFHHSHNHTNSLVSGVFYFNADPEVDRILFFKTGHIMIVPEVKELNPYNSTSWWFPVGTGGLIMFPSQVQHSVEHTQSRDTRISLAFNVFIRGQVGSSKNLTALEL
jgi:uncharacterized protein (TIGR02466 family)